MGDFFNSTAVLSSGIYGKFYESTYISSYWKYKPVEFPV